MKNVPRLGLFTYGAGKEPVKSASVRRGRGIPRYDRRELHGGSLTCVCLSRALERAVQWRRSSVLSIGRQEMLDYSDRRYALSAGREISFFIVREKTRRRKPNNEQIAPQHRGSIHSA